MDLNNNIVESDDFDSEIESNIQVFKNSYQTIDSDELKNILSIDPYEDLNQARISVYKHIYNACKDPFLVEYFDYTLDDIPNDLIEKFRNEENENNFQQQSSSIVKTSNLNLLTNHENMAIKETLSLKNNNVNEQREPIDSLSRVDKKSVCQTNVLTNNLIASEDDSVSYSQTGFSTRSHKNSRASSFILSSDDFLSLNSQIKSPSQSLSHSIRINQKMPRHEYYNQQRNLVKQLNKRTDYNKLLSNQITSMNVVLGNNQNAFLFQNHHSNNRVFSEDKINCNQGSNQKFDHKYLN